MCFSVPQIECCNLNFLMVFPQTVASVILLSVYSTFSDRVGLPLHNIPSSRVLMKSIGAEFLRSDALPDVNHIRGMQYQIGLNITFWPQVNYYS